jgi:hypothetical protein
MHFGNHYVHWREKRFQAILNHYPENFFQGKTLLELGAGHGDLGAMFAGVGAEVTCAEGRPQHIQVGTNRYYNLNMKFVQVNLEYDWPFEEFDIILNLGLIYHFKNPDFSIRNTCLGAKYAVLDSEMCDSQNPDSLMIVAENINEYDQALNGYGCRPSKGYVERVLKDCGVKFEMLTSDAANSPPHRYDWQERGPEHDGFLECGQRRMWFIERN